MNKRVKTALRRMQAQRFPSNELLSQLLPAASAVIVGVEKRTETRNPVRRRAVLVGGLVAALVAAAALVVPSLFGGTAYAATPPMLAFTPVATPTTAGEMLNNLAARARAQHPSGASTGRYHYQHQRGWYLGVAEESNNRILSSGIVETDREQWIADDGSGRLKVTGIPAAPNRTYAPGELFAGFLADTTSPDALRAVLNGNDTPIGWLRAVSDLWTRQVPSPSLQANLLTVLAGQPGLIMMGQTTDRVGRQGIAIGAEDHDVDERLILIFAPDTGALLDVESIALSPNGLPIRAPATVSYTVWVKTGYTATVEQRP